MKCLLTEVLGLRVQTRGGKAPSDQQQWEALSPLSLQGLGESSGRAGQLPRPSASQKWKDGTEVRRDTISTQTRGAEAAVRQASNIQLLVSPLICQSLSLANREPADQQAQQIQFTQVGRRMKMDWGRDERGTGWSDRNNDHNFLSRRILNVGRHHLWMVP